MKTNREMPAFLTLLLLWPAFIFAVEIHVDAKGDDANDGSRAKPVRTISRAQHLARVYAGRESVTVYLREADYHLSSPLTFTADDSGTAEAPVVYAALPGERPLIKGSLPVEAEWKPYKNGIFVCSLAGTPLAGRSFNQLFCNGQRMVRARYPDFDFDNPLRTGEGYLQTAKKRDRDKIVWKEGDLAARHWKNPQTGIAHVFHSHNWGNFQYRIESVDWRKRTIKLGRGGFQAQRRRKGHGGPFYLENIFEELDSPHEWFLDTEEDRLYFKPPAGTDISAAEVEAAVLKSIVRFQGSPERPVRHIGLEGLHFSQTQATFLDEYEDLARGDWAIHRGGAIYFNGAEDCRVEDCRIAGAGGNGLFADGYNRRIRVSGSLFEDLGDSAVCFVGRPNAVREYQTWGSRKNRIEDLEPGPKSPDYPAECTVSNCIMRNVGLYGKQTSGAFVSMAMDIVLSHCTIHDIPRAGVTFNDGTWGGHVMEHCDIWETVQDTGEHGPFNSWGRERFWDGNKKELVKLDAMKTVHLRNNRISNFRKSVSAGNWTIDLDDGSSNYRIYNNLSLGSTLKLRDGFFREVCNNIHVSAVPLGWHLWPEDSRTTFQRNITVIAGAPEGESNPTSGLIKAIRMPGHPWGEISSNLWYNCNSGQFAIDRHIQDMQDWRERGYGEGSRFADPRFADPLRFDFSVRPSSPAFKVGFKNFAMNDFGHSMTRIGIGPRPKQFERVIDIVLRADKRGGEVRYTLDGSEPTVDSALYVGPIRLDATTTIRAQTFKDGLPVGFPALETYSKVEQLDYPSWYQSLLAGSFVKPAADAPVPAAKYNDWAWQGAVLIDIIDGDMVDALGGHDHGVYVQTLDGESRLWQRGLRADDLIVAVDGKKVQDLAEFKKAISLHSAGEIRLGFYRSYEKKRISLPLEE